MKSSNIIIKDKVLKSFWRKEGMDYVADLGIMKNAIMVRYYTPKNGINYYAISIKSWFSFTKRSVKPLALRQGI